MFLVGDKVKVVDGDRVYDGVISHTSIGTCEAYVLFDNGIQAKWIDIHKLERMQEEVELNV